MPALGGILGAMCKASCLSPADLECLLAAVLKLHAWFQTYSWDRTWQSALVRCFLPLLAAERAVAGSCLTSHPLPVAANLGRKTLAPCQQCRVRSHTGPAHKP